MAGKKYTFKEMFPDLEKSLKEMAKLAKKLDTSIKKVKLAPATGEGLKTVNKELKTTVGYTKSLSALNKQRISEENKLNTANKKKAANEAKYNIEAQKTIANDRAIRKATADRAKALVALQRAEKGSTAELRAKNKLLNLQLNTLKIGSKRYDAYTKAIFRNTQALKQHGKRVNQNFLNVGNYMKNGINKMKASFAALSIGIFAALGVFRMLGRLFKTQLAAYDKQVAAEKSLEVALGRTSEALLKQASALQKKTRFGDEETIAAQAYLAQMGLEEDQILKLIPAIQDMATAKGMDLVKAADMVAKSVGSSTNALSRYGIEIEGAAGSNERLNSAVDALSSKFEGQATAAAKVGTGAIKQMSNAIGDLKERMGATIAEALTPFAQLMTKLVQESEVKQLEDVRDRVNELGIQLLNTNLSLDERKELLEELESINPSIVEGLDAENLSYETLNKNLEEYNQLMGNRIILANLGEEQEKLLTDSLRARTKVYQKSFDLNKLILENDRELAFENISMEEKIVSLLKTLGKKEVQDFKTLKTITLLKKASKDLIELRKEENEALKDVSGIDAQIEAMQKMFGISVSGPKGTKPTGKKGEAFDDQNLGESQPLGVGLFDVKETDLKNIIDNSLEKYKASAKFMEDALIQARKTWFQRFQDRLKDEDDDRSIFAKLFDIDKDDAAQIEQQITEAFNKAMSLIQQGLDARRAANDEIISMTDERIDSISKELEAEQKRVQELEESGAAYTDRSETIRAQLALEQAAKQKALVEDKRLREKQRKLDLVSAGINIAGSVIKALNTLPIPYNLILAGLMASLGAVQLSQIASAKYAEGTNYVEQGLNPSGKDTVHAMVNIGERIVPTEDNAPIPRTFPNSMLATAVNYYLDKDSGEYKDNLSGTPILNLGLNDVILQEIADNTKNDKVYHNGRLIREQKGNAIIRYN